MLAEFWEFLSGVRGMLYWVALTTLAGGATLLILSLYLKLRQKKLPWSTGTQAGAAARLHKQERVSSRGPAAGPGNTAWDPEGPDLRTIPQEPGPTGCVTDSSGTLATLADRLRGATDRLEEMAEELAAGAKEETDSGLKPLAGNVEYVFRASRH